MDKIKDYCHFVYVLFRCGFDSETADTRTFRQATWNYIHVLFGVYHDDYRYDEVLKYFSNCW